MIDPNDPLELVKTSWNPLRVSRKLVLIPLASIVVGLIIPALIAYATGVFYSADIKGQINGKIKEPAKSKIKEFDEQKNQLELRIKAARQVVLRRTDKSPAEVAESINALKGLDAYETELENREPPLNVVPFFLNEIMLIWAVEYTLLGWLILILNPASLAPIKRWGRPLALITLGLYVTYQWPNWMRNFVLTDEGRHVYAFANRDLSPWSFWTQEVNTTLYCLLLAVLWLQWAAFFDHRRSQLQVELGRNPLEAALSASSLRRLSYTFLHWQACSVLLAVAFVFFTGTFWKFVVAHKDLRYIIPAITIHVVWGITWWLVSLPLLVTWYRWQWCRSQAIEALASHGAGTKDEVELKLSLLAKAKPVEFWNLVASGVIAVASFVWPLVKPFILGGG
jgi:hypothetical protein